MKITIKTIKQIINEELDRLLYEEDNNDVLRKAVAKVITDEKVLEYDKTIKQKAQQMFNELLDDPKIKADPELVEFIKNEDYDIKQRIDIIPSLGHDLSKYQSTLEEIEPYPLERDLEDKKNYLAGKKIETKDLSDIDMSYANLNGADLSGFNLGVAELKRADLRRANLYGADLSDAGLIGADLSFANLRGANLSYASLAIANFYGADLSDANLTHANLSKANLNGADLSDANLVNARYKNNTQWPKGFDPEKAGAIKR